MLGHIGGLFLLSMLLTATRGANKALKCIAWIVLYLGVALALTVNGVV